MRLLRTLWLLPLIAGGWPDLARAQLELVPGAEAQGVFSGNRAISIVWRNAGNEIASVSIRQRLCQASAATVMPVGASRDWKQLQVLPHQTVVETVSLDFPSVTTGTRFLIQWLDESNKVLGLTDVMVYPTNLLSALKPLAGEAPVGVFDPQNQLKPLLKKLDVEFEDLADVGFDNFSGKLAITGPFQSKAQMGEGLANQIKAFAKKGGAIVWIQPPPEERDKLSPSFYTVMENTNAVIVVQANLVSDLPMNPRSQLNLIYFCQLALSPRPAALPRLAP